MIIFYFTLWTLYKHFESESILFFFHFRMASDPDLWTYLLLEHLPTESECVQAIVNVSSTCGSKK